MNRSEKAGKLEMRLLKALRNDSSSSTSKIARKLKEPVTTVFEAEKKLREKGIVTRYYSSIDFEKAGFPIRAMFFIDVEKEKLQETAEMLVADKSVNNLQLLEGGCSLFAEAVFAKIGQFFSFSEKLGEVKKKAAFYVVEEEKTESSAFFNENPSGFLKKS